MTIDFRRAAAMTLFVTTMAGSAVFAAGSGESAPAAESPRVVATTNIIGDVVANIAGDAVALSILVPSGQNPHSYEVTPREIAAVEEADLVFVNGFDLEEGLLDIVEQAARGRIVSLSESIDGLSGDDDEEDEGEGEGEDHDHAVDPHVWFSPKNVLLWIDVVEAALTAAYPDGAQEFRRNAAAYRQDVQALHEDILDRVNRIPRDRRKLVVDHVSLGYFARDYGFTVVGTVLPATTDQADPSPRAVAELVELIRRVRVHSLFVGETASGSLRDLVSAVAEEAGREVTVHSLLTGSLAAPGQPGDTYISYMTYNVNRIMEGLEY